MRDEATGERKQKHNWPQSGRRATKIQTEILSLIMFYWVQILKYTVQLSKYGVFSDNANTGKVHVN